MLVEGELLDAGRMVAHGQIVVAMEAFEGTPACHLNGHLKRRAFPLETPVDQTR
jgi:DUF1009 family protein